MPSTHVSGKSARWVYLALLTAAGAILLAWLSERAHRSGEPDRVQARHAGARDQADRSGTQALVETVEVDPRVEAGLRDCPGALPSEANLLVRVIAQDGRPIHGARVIRWDVHEKQALGRSDDAGVLESRIPECPGQTLVVVADSYATAYQDLPPTFPLRAEVTLAPKRSVSGRVIDMSGKPLAAVSVLAWPNHRHPSNREVASSSSDLELFPRVLTDGAGRFSIDGLHARETYMLVAGGASYTQVEPVEVDASVREGVELRLWRLHGIRLRVLAKGGGPPVLPMGLGTPRCTYFGHASERTYRAIDPRSPQAALTEAARAFALQGREYSLYDTVLLYASPEASDRLGPISYRYCVPGYSSATGELWIPPVQHAHVAEETLLLQQVVPVFGPLEVQIGGVPDGISPIHTALGAPLLVFARNAEADCEYFFPMTNSGSTELDGLLPTGRTDFVLGSTEWQQPNWNQPVATLNLTDQRNVLQLDLSRFGGLELELIDSKGLTVRGPIQVELRDAEGHVLRHLQFHRAPYRVYGLESGEYSLAVHQPYGPGDDSAHSQVFRITPREFVRVECLPGDVNGR